MGVCAKRHDVAVIALRAVLEFIRGSSDRNHLLIITGLFVLCLFF